MPSEKGGQYLKDIDLLCFSKAITPAHLQIVGTCLGFSKVDVEHIEYKILRAPKAACHDLLVKWRNKHGHSATLAKLWIYFSLHIRTHLNLFMMKNMGCSGQIQTVVTKTPSITIPETSNQPPVNELQNSTNTNLNDQEVGLYHPSTLPVVNDTHIHTPGNTPNLNSEVLFRESAAAFTSATETLSNIAKLMLKTSNTENVTEKEATTPTLESAIRCSNSRPTDSAAEATSTGNVYYAEDLPKMDFVAPSIKKQIIEDLQKAAPAAETVPTPCSKSWQEEIDECLQQYPCKHGGTCTDKVADFECSCREGWTGKRCETPMEYCDPLPCNNEGVCYNLTDGYFCRCPGGTTGVTCGTSPEVCSIINPCTMKGTCEDKGGTAQCNCNDEYAGTSCQLIKAHCADPNMCKHDGKCVTKPIGFECECGDSYSGSTCSIYTGPCSSNPCHPTAECISNKDKYMCYCEHGNLLTDNGCKDIDENFDIFMNRYKNGMPAYLRNPFVSHTNHSMTIMFWIRILARPGENPVLVSLEKTPIGTIIPTFNTSIQQLIVRGQSAILRGSTKTDYIQYGTDVADGKWHFMVFSLEPSGKVKLFIDSIKKTEYDRMSGILNFNQYVSWQVIFGSTDTLGRISKLRIYKTVFHDIDIYKAKDNTSHLPSDQLIQGWTNIKLTWSTFKKVPSGAGNDNVCDINFPNCLDGTKPSISCPDDQIKIGTERLTAFTGLKNSYNKNEDVQYVNTSVHYDELYTYGSSNEVFIGYDEALNYGICRFKVYVKYADCPRPETNADISYCPNSKHICELNCPTGEALCIKHKQKYRCGALGVYNFEHPRKKLILPTCGGQRNQTIALSVSLTYKTVTNCVPTFPSNIKTGLEVKLKTDLPNLWPMGAGMAWCGSQCIWDAICRGTSTYMDVTFTLHVPQLSASIERNGKTYKIREALFIFILQENGLNFNNVAGAQLERDSVNIDESSSCPDGYMVVRKQCVECGKGTYRNDTTMTCAFCAIGSYQTNVGRTVCEPCESSKTTLNFGSDSSTDCIDNCPPGSVPNNSDSGKISADMANTGIMIGLSIGLVLLLCIVVSVVIAYKRLTSDSDYSVPIDNNQYQVQSHEHHYDEMTNKSQQYLNVGSIPHSHGLSNNGYENADDNYATITEIPSGNSSSNNEYFELYEKPTETENI
ncbi:unnamed protein product [Mytilus edulis]|uniref:Uncharacterized protein n=1 Tax=Mytilus edulis TaxID=6550 RepID=A0A8S3Q1M0_MYTED|nr:unnamed protein product [Mytilus edulis]